MFKFKIKIRKIEEDIKSEIEECNRNIKRCDEEMQKNIKEHERLVNELNMNRYLKKEMEWWYGRRHTLKVKLDKMRNKGLANEASIIVTDDNSEVSGNGE